MSVMTSNGLRAAAVLFGKVHKWLLTFQDKDKFYWAANDDGTELINGEKKSLHDLLETSLTVNCPTWSISALTGPSLSDEEAALAADLFFPARPGPISWHQTPSGVLSVLLNYAERAFVALEGNAHASFRGFPQLTPALPEGVTVDGPPKKVSPYCMLLSTDALSYSKKLESRSRDAAYAWWNRGIIELLPCFYYQRIVGNRDGYYHYVLGTPDDMGAMEAVWEAETAAQDTAMSEPAAVSLYRVIGNETPTLTDLRGTSASSDYIASLTDLDKRLVVLCSWEKRLPYPVVAESNSDTQKKLIAAHRADAFAPLMRDAFGEATC